MTQFFTLIVLIVSVGGGFENLLSVRDFRGALSAAENSDSLKAAVFLESGNYAGAAVCLQRAFDEKPSADLLCGVWNAVALGSEHFSSVSSGVLRHDLVYWGERLFWSADNLESLIESADMLGDSSLSDSLVLVLTDRFAGSPQASEVIGWKFYDAVIPVWNDDSAKLVILMDFIHRWGGRSELWRSTAWRYTLSTVVETADSVQWEQYFNRWMLSCPEDPTVFLKGASFFIDRDSSWVEALELSETGLDLLHQGWVPQEMPTEEWELTAGALENSLQFRRLWAMAGLGRNSEAASLLNGIISAGDFDVDDYHTKSCLYWLQGRLFLAEGDTTAALASFAESSIEGDVRNKWSDLSEKTMQSVLPPGVTPVRWAREHTGYSGPVFENTTELLSPDSLVRGTRVSWCDWNSDGMPDIYLGRSLFQNVNGVSFVSVTHQAGLDSCRGNGGIWGDIDGDGTPDLVTSGNPVQVFVNTDGILMDVTERMGVQPTDAAAEGVALLDWNADGWLDLYLASYEGGMGEGTADKFYLGGEHGFTEVGDSLGMVPFLDKPLCGRGVSPCDYDSDGDIDVFVSNYRLQENFMWKNENGKAFNAALSTGVAGVDVEGWWGHTIGSAWGDYDNDGDWDLYSANLAHPRYIEFSDRSMLLQNTAGSFTDVRAQSGIRFEETHSNPLWGDFNNDGFLDLFVTSIYPDRRSFLYLNRGDGTFDDVTWLSGARVFNGWGAAAGDFDTDGRLDLAVGSGDGFTLLRNTTPDGNWLLVNVSPPTGVNSSGLGCVVRVEQDGITLVRQVEGGSGTSSQNSGMLHFGLLSDDSVTVKMYIPGQVEPVYEEDGVSNSVITAGMQL